MKKSLLLPLLLSLFLASACQMDTLDAAPEANSPNVTEAAVPAATRRSETLEFWVKFDKPSPCHQVKEVKVSTTGLTVNYDIILHNSSPCPTINGIQDSVEVVFAPQQTGDHTLNFLLNNRLYLVRKVTVLP